MAGLVTVRYSDYFEDDLIVNHNDIFIAGFTPVLTVAPTDTILHNSLRFAFEPSGGNITALISGNDLPLFPPEPFLTLSLCIDGGLNQLGTTMDSSREWATPNFDLDNGVVSPAVLIGFNSSGQIDISAIPDFGYAYIGYATSDLGMFGYMQIQRLSLTQWRLVGYAYEDAGNPIKVIDLVPSAPTLLPLAAGLAVAGRKRTSDDRKV